MRVFLVVAAGGSGNRMQSAVPKQFMLLGDKPIIARTIEVFEKSLNNLKTIVVINEDYISLWNDIVNKYNIDVYKVVQGGKERFFSVRNALEVIENYDENDVVLIHDAVRPLVNRSVITNVVNVAYEQGSAIPVYKISDSVRKITNNVSKIIDRSDLYLVQTPQGFNLSKLKKAYGQNYSSSFTDDASVYESAGFNLNFVEGNRENIKITYPQDLAMAKCILSSIRDN